MPYKNKMDMHIHSDNSPDGAHSVILMCEYAMRSQLRAVAFTDHCEVDAYEKGRFDRSIRQSFFEAHKGRAAFEGRMIVLAGLELGQPLRDPLKAAMVVQSEKFDMILSSVHGLPPWGDFFYMDFTGNPELSEQLLDAYYKEIYEMVKWGNFDALAHLNYPLRYIEGRDGVSVDMNRFDDVMQEILRLAAGQGKALEINMSNYRNGIEKTDPSPELIKRFRQLGGEFVTVGSDAHRGGDICLGVEDGMKAAFEAGFRKQTFFRGRNPVQISIV